MWRRQGLSCRGLTYSPSSVTVHPSLSSRPGVAEASGDAYPASPIRLAAPLHSASVLLSGSLQEANRYLEGAYLFLFLRSEVGDLPYYNTVETNRSYRLRTHQAVVLAAKGAFPCAPAVPLPCLKISVCLYHVRSTQDC